MEIELIDWIQKKKCVCVREKGREGEREREREQANEQARRVRVNKAKHTLKVVNLAISCFPGKEKALHDSNLSNKIKTTLSCFPFR